MGRMKQKTKAFFLSLGTAAFMMAAPMGVLASEKGPGAAMKPSVNGVSIYVSKMGSTLTLSQYGRTIGQWSAKLGRESSTGDKKQQGDEITPSGKFYVCTKNDKSQYYLALGLSYPGIEDAERGLKDGLITQEQYDAIVEAMLRGEYYSSSGPAIYNWGIKENNTVWVNCSACERVNFSCGGYINAGGTVIAPTRDGLRHVEFSLRGTETYVRIECVDYAGKITWTNAHFLEDEQK